MGEDDNNYIGNKEKEKERLKNVKEYQRNFLNKISKNKCRRINKIWKH